MYEIDTPITLITIWSFPHFFLSSFWLRTFASKTDRDLWLGVSMAVVAIAIILTLVGVTGLIAVWSGALDMSDPEADGSIAFFLLLAVVSRFCAEDDVVRTHASADPA